MLVASTPDINRGPNNFITCYICDRKFSHHSYKFHEPKCLQRWRAENQLLPRKDRSSTPKKSELPTPGKKQTNCLIKPSPPQNLSKPSKSMTVLSNVSSVSGKRSKVSSEVNDSDVPPERPRTQTLLYPSPDIIHPIIPPLTTSSNAKSDKTTLQTVIVEQPRISQSNQKKSRNKIGKKLGKLKKSPSPTSCCGFQFSSDLSDKSLSHCFSCDRLSRPEKLHRHKSILDNKILGRTMEETRTSSELFNKTKFKLPVKVYKCIRVDNAKSTERAVLVSNKGAPKPKRFVVCHICGNKIAQKSFTIHLPRCLERWEIENDNLPTGQLHPVSERAAPVGNSVGKKNNNMAAWEVFQNQLVPCPRCLRTLLPERLAVHQRSCSGEGSVSNETEKKKVPPLTTAKKAVKKPPMVVCYICGRQFGSHSIGLHEPQCLKKWNLENNKLPKHQRREEPRKPETILNATDTEPGTIDQTSVVTRHNLIPLQHKSDAETQYSPALHGNAEQAVAAPQPCTEPPLFAAARSSALQPFIEQRPFAAPHSSALQTFPVLQPFTARQSFSAPQRVTRQQPFPGARSCWLFFLKRDGSIDLDAMAEAAWQSHLDQLVPCDRCGRTFLPDRLPIHQRGCHESNGVQGNKKGRRN